MLYKYATGATGASTLERLKSYCENYTLMVSKPATFNDPFEFKVAIDYEADEQTIRERYFLDNKDASQSTYDEWRSHFDQAKWSITQNVRNGLLSRYGVFCLSEVENNHLMWSHYAKNHRGFCIGFDESLLVAMDGHIGGGPITYLERAPVFRFFWDAPGFFDQAALGCKSAAWAYEREHRLMFNHTGISKFPRTALKEVIIGCRAYPELRAYAQQHCEDEDVRFCQMTEDFQAYGLTKRAVEKNVTFMSSFF